MFIFASLYTKQIVRDMHLIFSKVVKYHFLSPQNAFDFWYDFGNMSFIIVIVRTGSGAAINDAVISGISWAVQCPVVRSESCKNE